MLTIYAEKFGMDTDRINQFADLVNERDEAGSLYPLAPVSAIPRRYLREEDNPDGLVQPLREFLNMNANAIMAGKVAFDMRLCGGPVPRPVVAACRAAIETSDTQHIETAMIVLG